MWGGDMKQEWTNMQYEKICPVTKYVLPSAVTRVNVPTEITLQATLMWMQLSFFRINSNGYSNCYGSTSQHSKGYYNTCNAPCLAD